MVDDIIIRAMYIDDVIGNNQMMKMIDDLAKNPKFKNPEDLFSNIDACMEKVIVNNKKISSAEVEPLKVNSLLNEFNEGKYWMDRGEEVMISKKLTPNKIPDNEVDVVLISGNNKGIVECKYPNKDGVNATENVFANLKLIVDKFNDEGKLTKNWKNLYPKRYGQINIANGAFSNLNTPEEFVNAIKNYKLKDGTIVSLIGEGPSKLFTLNDVKKLEELHILVNGKRIIIKPTDW